MNIPSVAVKGTSAVLLSSANLCNISQNMHYKAPVTTTLKDQNSGLDMER